MSANMSVTDRQGFCIWYSSTVQVLTIHDNIPLEHANLITTTQAEMYAHSFLELSFHL